MKKQVVMADRFRDLQQYLQSTTDGNGDLNDYDMITDTFRIGGRNSLSIDRHRRNDARLPDINADLDDYDMVGDHNGRSPFSGDIHRRDGKLTDVKFLNSFEDDFDDSDIV